jgi:glycosyltransferase involved in cell wall biosynthesis
MKISFITTVLNEKDSLELFLQSILEQTQHPDEIIVVDGGSTDGTLKILQAASKNNSKVKYILDLNCNIRFSTSPVARGRNTAIREATGEIIVVSDAGCRLSETWVEEITKPFFKQPEIDIVAGWYEPWVESDFERAVSSVTFTISKEKLVKDFAPSSRSIAFRKSLWQKIGGYPEIALTAEDTLFNRKIKQEKAKLFFAEKAIVYWRPRRNIRELYLQFYRYGKGDGICGLNFQMYFQISIKCLTLILLTTLSLFLKVIVYFLFAIFLLLGYLTYLVLFKNYNPYPLTSAFLKILIDIARICGFIVGAFKKLTGQHW